MRMQHTRGDAVGESFLATADAVALVDDEQCKQRDNDQQGARDADAQHRIVVVVVGGSRFDGQRSRFELAIVGGFDIERLHQRHRASSAIKHISLCNCYVITGFVSRSVLCVILFRSPGDSPLEPFERRCSLSTLYACRRSHYRLSFDVSYLSAAVNVALSEVDRCLYRVVT